MKFIDIHTHIVYGLDDGSKSLDESINMLTLAKKQNYESLVFTPHIDFSRINLYEDMYKCFLELKGIADSCGLSVYIGNEILLDDYTLDLFESKRFYTLNNSSYVLIECNVRGSYHHMLDNLDLYLNAILSKGYIPVIAHIERYFNKEIDLDYVSYLIDKGCIIQVNTNSIINDKLYKKVQPLLDHQYVHIIASDAHNTDKRVPNMEDAYHVLVKKHYDIKYIEDMMYYHPKSILVNKRIVIGEYRQRNIIYKSLKL